MKIPHKVRIKPKVFYEVVFVDRFDDPNQYGECFHSDHEKDVVRQIRIKANMSPMMTRQTFWHELLHAFEFEYEIAIKHSSIFELQVCLERFFRINKLNTNPRGKRGVKSNVSGRAVAATKAGRLKKKPKKK
jgi:hypothetical protein